MSESSIPHVEYIDRYVGRGVTKPLVAYLSEDGKWFLAIIKLKTNPEQIVTLINEYISSEIAQACNIPVPKSGFAVIDDATNKNGRAGAADMGTCFYSTYVDSTSRILPKLLNGAKNKDDFESIMLFDFIIDNTDRHRGNFVVDKRRRLYAIDHTHAFHAVSSSSGPAWNRESLRRGMAERDFRDPRLATQRGYDALFEAKEITLESLQRVAAQLKQVIDRGLLEHILGGLPSDWPLDGADANALVDYLLYRTDHLYDYCKTLAQKRGLD